MGLGRTFCGFWKPPIIVAAGCISRCGLFMLLCIIVSNVGGDGSIAWHCRPAGHVEEQVRATSAQVRTASWVLGAERHQ